MSEYANKERIVDFFTELVNINSPSFGEGEIAERLIRELRYLGLSVIIQEFDNSFNIIAYKKGSVGNVAPLILSAHMDTIEPTLGMKCLIDDEKISSDGSTVLGADDKSGIAQIIETLNILNERGIAHGDLEIVFTSAEETGLTGAKNLDFSMFKSRHAIVPDCEGSVGGIVLAAPTHDTYEMVVKGKAAHAGIEPEKGINAVKVASRIITGLPDGRIDSKTTANVGVFQGGKATNVVSDQALIKGEVRSHDTNMLDTILDSMFNSAKDVVHKSNALIDIRRTRQYDSFEIDKGDPFVKLLANALGKCGIEPEYKITGGGSDANIFNKYGITALDISSGMVKPHTKNEYILIDDLIKGTHLLVRTIEAFVLEEFKGQP